MKGYLSSMYRRAYIAGRRQQLYVQPSISDGLETEGYQIPPSPNPKEILIGVQLEGQSAYTASGAVNAVSGATPLSSAMGRAELTQNNDNAGTIMVTATGLKELHRYLLLKNSVEDTLTNFGAGGTSTFQWNAFIPFCGEGMCTFRWTTGNVASAYATLTTQSQTFTIYAVYANRDMVTRRIMCRETGISSITTATVTSNLSAIDGYPLVAIMITGDASGYLSRLDYSDDASAFQVKVQTIKAENEIALQQLTRSTGVYWVAMLGRRYFKDKGILITPTFTTSTAPNITAIQQIEASTTAPVGAGGTGSMGQQRQQSYMQQ